MQDKSSRHSLMAYIRQHYCRQTFVQAKYWVSSNSSAKVLDAEMHGTVLDYGIEFCFANGASLFFGRDLYWDIISLSEFSPSTLQNSAYCEDLEIGTVSWANVQGQKLQDVNFFWESFEDLNGDRHFVPQLLELHMENGKRLAVASCRVDVLVGKICLELEPDGDVLVMFSDQLIEMAKAELRWT